MGRETLGRRLVRRFARPLERLDRVEDAVQPRVRGLLSSAMPLRDALDGTWLGTPLHPMLTDVPLGATSAALVLDSAESLSGSARFGVAADGALLVGVLATVPTAVTGASDWRDLVGEARRVAALHALLNVGAWALNTCSVVLRTKGCRTRGKAVSAAGFALSALAAHLGGELSYGYAVRVNQEAGHVGPSEFTEVCEDAALHQNEFRRVEVGGAPVLLARSRSGEVCAMAALCNHAGGHLDEGEQEDDTVVCPLHGSCFDLRTGAVVHGPAVFPQPRYEARVRDGVIAVRRAID